MNAFDKLTNAQTHAQEITGSRFGWFGGSDAKTLLDVYLKRRDFMTMSNTQRNRFDVLMGWQPTPSSFETPATRAGHAFEDYMQDKIKSLQNAVNGTLEREKVLRGDLYHYFGTMAHADYVIGERVFELKYTYNSTTEDVAKRYKCQLQWYYMLGAKDVVLVHGEECGENINGLHVFQCFRVNEWYVPRDEELICALREACEWADFVIDKEVQMRQNSQSVF